MELWNKIWLRAYTKIMTWSKFFLDLHVNSLKFSPSCKKKSCNSYQYSPRFIESLRHLKYHSLWTFWHIRIKLDSMVLIFDSRHFQMRWISFHNLKKFSRRIFSLSSYYCRWTYLTPQPHMLYWKMKGYKSLSLR